MTPDHWPTDGPSHDPLTPDHLSEFYDLQMKIIRMQKELHDHTFDTSTATSDELVDHLSGVAHEMHRFALQLEATPCDEIEESVLKDISQRLLEFAETAEEFNKSDLELTERWYEKMLTTFSGMLNIAESIVRLLGMSRGDPLYVESSFINERGEFGNHDAHPFAADALIALLERIPTQAPQLFLPHSTRFIFQEDEIKNLKQLAEDLKKTIIAIAESFNAEEPILHLQEVLLLIVTRLCLILRVIRRDAYLPFGNLFLPQFFQFARRVGIDYKKLSLKGFVPGDALRSSINMLKLMQRTAERVKE